MASADTPGADAARTYKYYRQFVNSRITSPVPERRVSARALYSRHSAAFDRFAAFFSKHGLDIRRYLEFMATEVGLKDEEIDSKLLSRWGMNLFAEKLAAEDNKRKVYGWYTDSVRKMAETCLCSDYASTADLLRGLIRENKLAAWVAGGRVSAYYLAAIPGLPKIIAKLDSISRDELSYLSERYDMYNTAVNEAVLAYEHRKANPVRATDEMVEKIRPEWSRTQADPVFDPSLDFLDK